MKNSSSKSTLTGLSGVCLCLLCGGVLAGEPGGDSQSEQNTATDTRTDTTATNPGREDILDRAFSPLDRAVSDINRDMNKDLEKDLNNGNDQQSAQPRKQPKQ